MIHFIYGEDTYSSRQALKKIESDFVKKYGDLNFDRINGCDVRKGLLESKAQAMPFLSEKRIVIVDGFLAEGNKEVKKTVEIFLDQIPDFSDLIFYEEGSPDRRESLFKKLDKVQGKQTFGLLDPFGLRKWIEKRIICESLKISPNALNLLSLYVGSDLYRLNNEIER